MVQLEVLAFMDVAFGHGRARFKTMVTTGHVTFRREARAQLDARRAITRDICNQLLGADDEENVAASTPEKPAALMFVDVGPLEQIRMCPTCENERTLQAWQGRFKRYGFTVPAKGRRCRICKDTLVDASTMQQQELIVAHALATRGLRRGGDFKLARRISELRVDDVALVCGVTPTLVTTWESGSTSVPPHAAEIACDLVKGAKRAALRKSGVSTHGHGRSST